MTFNSIEFLGFLAVVATIYWQLSGRARLGLLLVSSCVFYGWWDYRFIALIALSATIGFLSGLALERATDERHRKGLLWGSVILNLGILGWFKYWDFFVDGATDLLTTIGLEPSSPLLDVVVPVGISFYTLQVIAYSFDVYRRRIEPTGDALLFAVSVVYFPKLVAGPLERPVDLIGQLREPPARLVPARLWSGLGLIGRGLVKKVIIADTMAPIVAGSLDRPGGIGAVAALAGILAFGVQIYAEFSGYTDLARGSSRLLGIELTPNFLQPYLSRNVTEFWRRWHVTLSAWLRQYLYIPLGGNRLGTRRTYLNVLATMVLGGLWHGPSLTFVAWGGFHGLLLALHRPRRHTADDRRPLPARSDLGRVAGTFALVSFGWAIFRSPTLAATGDLLRELVRPEITTEALQDLSVAVVMLGVVLINDIMERTGSSAVRPIASKPIAAGALTGALLLGLVVASANSYQQFVYFRF